MLIVFYYFIHGAFVVILNFTSILLSLIFDFILETRKRQKKNNKEINKEEKWWWTVADAAYIALY